MKAGSLIGVNVWWFVVGLVLACALTCNSVREQPDMEESFEQVNRLVPTASALTLADPVPRTPWEHEVARSFETGQGAITGNGTTLSRIDDDVITIPVVCSGEVGDLSQALRFLQQRARGCVHEVHKWGRNLQGHATIRIKIGSRGEALSFSAIGHEPNARAVVTCLHIAVDRTQFPVPKGGSAEIEFRMKLGVLNKKKP